MAIWFELNQSNNRKFNFALKAGSDHALLKSGQHESIPSAQDAIALIRDSSFHDVYYVEKLSAGGKPYSNLKAGNREILGALSMYGSQQGRGDDMASVKANGTSRMVEGNTQCKPDMPVHFFCLD